MPRVARLVIPGQPHLVAQRGHHGRDIFQRAEDTEYYLNLLNAHCVRHGLVLNGYCLLRDQVQLILTPPSADSLRNLGEVQRRYAYYFNRKLGREGDLWHDRFSSRPLNAPDLARTLAQIEYLPVEAGVCESPMHYRWSSARLRHSSVVLLGQTQGEHAI